MNGSRCTYGTNLGVYPLVHLLQIQYQPRISAKILFERLVVDNRGTAMTDVLGHTVVIAKEHLRLRFAETMLALPIAMMCGSSTCTVNMIDR